MNDPFEPHPFTDQVDLRWIEVKTYRVKAYCDHGNPYTYTGYMLASNPPQYRHKTGCAPPCWADLSTSYPHISHQEV